ncbi:MAG TPA: AAA family ATPase [Patescibacteria group bacterium]|nr:AAA family ATPase [Patescibacteria group bacterium]
MYLKKLEINGFKSFAKKTTLEFTSGITAVVGPNGSGKSNVADSLRWVMGEQSIKTLRGKKSEDVIFSGSDKKARLGLAEVSMELDNTDGKVPIDYRDLLITRKIYRNGESEYLINGGKSKLADINLLLTQANFGHRTYAIIGQGMIDNFLIATPEERKEFFDEATGVKQYQIKKNQTIVKLNQVWQNLTTANIRLKEMEPQLNLLTRQIKKLNKRKEIEAELNELRLNYYSAYWQTIDRDYQQELSKINQLEADKKIHEDQWKKLEAELDNIVKNSGLNQEIEKLRLEQQAVLDKKMRTREELWTMKSSLVEKTRPHTNTKTLSLDKITELNQQIENINSLGQKALADLGRGLAASSFKILLADLNDRVKSLLLFIKPYLRAEDAVANKPEPPQELRALDKKIADLDHQAGELQTKIQHLLSEDEAKRSALWQTQQKYQAAQQAFSLSNNQLNEVKISLARVETKRFDLKQEIIQELGSLEVLRTASLPQGDQAQNFSILDKINRLKGQLEIIGGLDPEVETEYQRVQARYDFLTAQTNDLNQTIASLKKVITDLEQIIKKQMSESFNEINTYFQKYFKILFNGGQAELSLIKEDFKPAEEESLADNSPATNFFQEKSKDGYSGIEIYATPPGKKLKSISILSGGERALTSIALICAIISSNPAPFVVLDEVDAALDESNSLRFAQILSDLSHKTQFIVITHNRATMEKAKLLYGVTMGEDGISKLISIKLEDSKEYIKK